METIEFEHPVARSILTKLRERSTQPDEFRKLAYRLGFMLAVEATRNLGTLPLTVETPMENTLGEECTEYPMLLPVMRAGLGLLAPFLELLPESPVAFIAMKRDEKTGKADWLYDSIANLRGRDLIILDPMLATAGTARSVIDYVLAKGAVNITMVSIVASPEGIYRLRDYDNLTFITVSVDRELDENWFILPGLGDFGDRLYKGK
ncbi:uracil phosphoribosyltransferase [Candidatus Fermentibacteria bacterium]|nr:MAG: uracil phosphoribosyltransferase [Candidatus Fermentibacteria bacterium]